MPAATEKEDRAMRDVRRMIASCLQCGTCTGSCPNQAAMDYTPRRLWRLVLMGNLNRVLDSRTFALCSACYQCTLRCPRELPLTDAMAALKIIAHQRRHPAHKRDHAFHEQFLASVRRHGRVNESEFMSLYFLSMGDPFASLGFAPLGARLFFKGKIGPPPFRPRGDRLAAVFDRAARLEAQP